MALVDDADRSLKSAFDIIDRLLAFARRQELSPRATELGELICGFVSILRQAAGPRIELDLDVKGGRPLACVIDPIHLESALLNLVLNSKDAMPNGGRIVIELREVQAPRKRKMWRGLQSPALPWAEIAVRDNGSGMSRHVLEHALRALLHHQDRAAAASASARSWASCGKAAATYASKAARAPEPQSACCFRPYPKVRALSPRSRLPVRPTPPRLVRRVRPRVHCVH